MCVFGVFEKSCDFGISSIMFRSVLERVFTVHPCVIKRTIKRTTINFALLDQIKKKLPGGGNKGKGGKDEQEEKNKCISVFRYNPDYDEKPYMQNYEIELAELRSNPLTLDALEYIRSDIDPSLSYRRSCREGICGSCTMNINGVNHLACIYPLPPGEVVVYPLPHLYVIKDLIVDLENFYEQYRSIQPYLQRKCKDEALGKRQLLQSIREREKLEGLYECILCACCSSSCPAYWWHGNKPLDSGFWGPAALLQAYRWVIDSRDENHCERLKTINGHATFRCHTIINCTTVCPKGLNPAKAISELKRMIVGITEKEHPDFKNEPVFADDPSEFDPNKRAKPVEAAQVKK